MGKEQGQKRRRNSRPTVVLRRTSPRFAKKPEDITTSQDAATIKHHLSSQVSPELIAEQNQTEPSSGRPVSFNQHTPSTKATYQNHMSFLSPRQLNNLVAANRGGATIPTAQNRIETSSVSFNQLSSQTQETDQDHGAFLSPGRLNDTLASSKLMEAKRGDIIIQAEKDEMEHSSGTNLTKMAGMCSGGSSSDEEVDSEVSLVTVGAYRVRAEWAPLLRAILEKHGDIAEGCSRAETSEWRSQFLELCCRVVQFLREAEFERLTAGDIERKLRSVGELERQDVRVGWLRERLEDILEARKIVKHAAELKASRDSKTEAVGSAEKRLREYELEASVIAEKIRRCKLEAAAIAQRIGEVKGELITAKQEAEEVRDFISRGRAKVKRFYKQPLVDDLI